ncbi:MAG: CGNR zinc finger domain-containing protein [Nocardioidaceae bacterium]
MHKLPSVTAADVVDLVNEYSAAARLADQRRLHFPELPGLHAFRASRAAKVAAADRLHPVFAATEDAPATLNALVAELNLSPQVDDTGSIRWAVPRRQDRLLGACTATMIEWTNDKGLARHGVCDASRCADVYVDTSRPGTRRYCSDGCLNRGRVASWRARQRRGTGS